MSTPITDAAWEMEENQTWSATACEMKEVARRLETDRAALLEALESVLKYSTPSASVKVAARASLTAARANFPQP